MMYPANTTFAVMAAVAPAYVEFPVGSRSAYIGAQYSSEWGVVKREIGQYEWMSLEFATEYAIQ
jgi:hypothetical protein